MRLLLLVVALLTACGPAEAQVTARIERIELIEAGVYQAPAPRADGSIDLTALRLVEVTNRIQARVGTVLGFRYVVVGEPSGARIPVTLVTRFPGQGMRDLTTGGISSRREEAIEATLGVPNISGFKFDEPREILPGPWWFELWIGNRRMFEHRFDIARAR